MSTQCSTFTETTVPTVSFETRSSAETEGEQTVPLRRRTITGPVKKKTNLLLDRFLFLLVNVIPAAMVVLGSVFFSDCPAEPLIPIWLIIGGCLYLLTTVLDLIAGFRHDYDRLQCIRILDHFLVTLMLIWLVFGSVWIYSIETELYCHSVVYWTSHLLVSFSYAFIVLISICLIIVGGMVEVFG